MLANRRIAAPFKPQIKDETDVSNFSEEFTNMMAADSPAIVPLNSDKIFKVIYFHTLLYTSITLVFLTRR